jgi:hypothetical protein
MNAAHPNWPVRAVWTMLAVAAIWVLYTFGSHYTSCRADGSGQVLCFILALFFGWLEVLFTVIGTVIRLIVLIMP